MGGISFRGLPTGRIERLLILGSLGLAVMEWAERARVAGVRQGA